MNTIYPSRKKIVITTLFIILFFTSLLIALEIYLPLKSKTDQVSPNMRFQNFYSQNFSGTNNVVLMGSSHVGMINGTVVQENINRNLDDEYVVYNLADDANFPAQRISQIEQIITMKPKLVIYGISYRDLFSVPTKQTGSDIFLEKTKTIVSKLVNNDEPFENPQRFVRLHLFNSGYQPGTTNCFYQLNTPFYPYCPDYYLPKTLEELKKQDPPFLTGLSKENVNAISSMIDRFNKENIRVVFFVTPVHEIYMDQLPDSQKNSFDEQIRNFKQKHGISVYDFRHKYDEFLVWVNTSHIIANNPVYDMDVAKMILEEIK